MSMPRKADSLSVNTLIIVALGILVLVLSIVAYNQYYDRSDETLSSCQNMGGECISATACSDGGGQQNFLASCGEGTVCCIGVN